MAEYPVELHPDDNGTVMALFPDVPEAVSFGDSPEEALAHAADALETALAAYVSDRRSIPAPSHVEGAPLVALTLVADLKLRVYEAMRACGWKKADLARALGCDPRLVDRLLSLTHNSTIEQLELALKACRSGLDVRALPRIDIQQSGADATWSVWLVDIEESRRVSRLVCTGRTLPDAVAAADRESRNHGDARIVMRTLRQAA